MFSDLRYAARRLWKSPGFTLVAVLTLALGIGASTAMFAIIDSVLLRPLPFKEPYRLVKIDTIMPRGEAVPTAAPDFVDWQRRNRCFEGMTAGWDKGFAFQSGDQPREINAETVLPNFFDVVGAKPILGRTFRSDSGSAAAETAVILNESFWTRQFSRDPQILGKKIVLDGISYEVVGVMSGQFMPGSVGIDCWIPVVFTHANLKARNIRGWTTIARLKPDVVLASAQAEMTAISRAMAKEYNIPFMARLVPLAEELTGYRRSQLVFLFGIVGCLTLIVCINLANLILSRSSSRLREFAVRTALGAGRWRLIGQFILETTLVGLIAGLIGWLVAMFLLDLFLRIGVGYIPKASPVSLNGTVFVFALALALLTGLLTGLLPARTLVSHASADLQTPLRDTNRAGSSASQGLVQNGLVLLEVVGSVVMLCCTGLLLHSFLVLERTNTGMSAPDKVLTARLTLPNTTYQGDEDLMEFAKRLHENLQREPGIRSAGFINLTPLSGVSTPLEVSLPSRSSDPSGPTLSAQYRVFDGDYFAAAGIPLVAGRFLDENDDQSDTIRVVVNQRCTSLYWNDPKEAIGQTITVFGEEPVTIVGVTSDIRQISLVQEPASEIDLSLRGAWRLAQKLKVRLGGGDMMDSAFAVIIRGAGSIDGNSLVRSLRNAVRKTDPTMPVQDIKTIDNLVHDTLSDRQFVMGLVASFAIAALLLASLGLYGVISYNVTQRTREYGVRIALGARSQDILRLVVGGGMKITGIGIAIGVLLSLGIGAVLGALLYGVSSADPATFVGVAIVVTLVALLANYFPARRAMKINPITALREE
jgi:putative ABC transport system permease protein